MEPSPRDTAAPPSPQSPLFSPPPPPQSPLFSPPPPPEVEPELLPGETYAAFIERETLYSTNSPRPSKTLLLDDYPGQASPPPMLSELDMEVETILLSQQHRSSYINDQYARVPNIDIRSLNPGPNFSNEEPLPVRDQDPNSSRPPVTSYKTELCSPSYPLYQTEYGLQYDRRSVGRNPINPRHERSSGLKHDHPDGIYNNPSLAAGNVPEYPSFRRIQEASDCFSWNSVATNSKNVNLRLMAESMSWILDSDLFVMMKSEYGNYPFKLFLKLCELREITKIVVRLSADPKKLVEVATDKIGCASFKVLVDAVKTLPILCEYLLLALSPVLHELMDTEYIGPRMIQYLLNQLDPGQKWPIYKAANEHLSSLSRKPTGVISLNKCIEKLFSDELTEATRSYGSLLLSEVLRNPVELATDEYGNYVVQCAIGLGIKSLTSFICNKLKYEVHLLSLNKYGTFVLEKCLNSSGAVIILQSLLTCEKQVLREINKNPYGNYVMQTAMEVLRKLPLHQEFGEEMRQVPTESVYRPRKLDKHN